MQRHSPFDISRLSAILSATWQKNVAVHFAKCLNTGYSGATVCQVELHSAQSIEFAVVKVAGEGKNDDLRREYQAMREVRQNWPAEVLPNHCELFIDDLLVTNRPEAALLITSFVHPTDTRVATLRELLSTDKTRSEAAIVKTLAFYDSLTQPPYCDKYPVRSGRDYFMEALGDNLCCKLQKCDWYVWAGIQPQTSHIMVDDMALPSAAYFFSTPESWNDLEFSAPCVPLHGDLNVDNLMILPDGKLMFIDFEKFRYGLVYWDIAFLLVWIAQVILLDGKNLKLEYLTDLVLHMASSLGPKNPAPGVVSSGMGYNLEPFASLAERFLFPLGDTTDNLATTFTLQPNRGKAASLAIAAASLARAYYQFRAATMADTPQDAILKRRQGLFFYALSCAALKRSDVLKPSTDVKYQSLYALESKPGAKTAGSVCTAAELLETALRQPIQSRTPDMKAVFTRLVFEVPFTHSVHPLPGWKRVVSHMWGYFSKLNAATNPTVRQATDTVLIWEPAEDVALPLVYELDQQVLGDTCHLVFKNLHFTLAAVDLIPLTRHTAMLGLLFQREGCLTGDYLKWVSSRNFGKMKLAPVRAVNTDSPETLSLGHLRRELAAAIQAKRLPVLTPLSERPTSDMDMPKVLQCLLWPDLNMALQPQDGTAEGQALGMIATLSRPNPDYPKEPPDDCKVWDHPSSGKSLYCLNRQAFTLISDPSVDFNYQTKPTIFMQANYLIWLLARELARKKAHHQAEMLLECFDEPLRRDIFQKCYDFFRQA